MSLNRRIGILFALFLALLAAALFRAVWLGGVQGGSLARAADTQQVTLDTVPAQRGAITDRTGLQLAISESADDLAADPYVIKDPGQVAARLASLLGQPVGKLITALTRPHTGYVLIAHDISPQLAKQILDLKIGGERISGLWTVPQVKRNYPLSWVGTQVIGEVGDDDQGLAGIEAQFNRQLRGTNGERRTVKDAKGQTIAVDDVKQAKSGKTVQLTIDANLQEEVEKVLAGVGRQYSPKGATAIAMDPNTGQVLALANWPRVNANDPGGAPGYATLDRAVGYTYEPGSTFKAITVAGALQDGVVTPNTTFDVPPMLQVADRQIHDAEPHGYVNYSVADILRVSSNIGADEIGIKLGARRFDYWVHRFGFGAPTGIALPREEQGIVLHASQYSGSSMGNLPIGQGESVTPIQMAAAYSAIANGGILRSPQIVKSIGGKAVRTPKGKRVISQFTAAELRTMLQGVFADGGTASGAEIPGYHMAGKTGTASVVVGNQYSKTQYIASFIGFVPTNKPKLLVAVMADEPHGAIYGGSVAAPAFQKIVGWAVPYFGISPR